MSIRAMAIAAVVVLAVSLVISAALGTREASSAAPATPDLEMYGGHRFSVRGYSNVGIGGMILHGVETASGGFWSTWEVSYLGTDAAGTRHISILTSGVNDKEPDVIRGVIPAGQAKSVTLFAFPGLKRPVRVVASLNEGKDGTVSAAIVSTSTVKQEIEESAAEADTAPSSVAEENNPSSGKDDSLLTAPPKDVYVQGYYRKDGTYVRGHYRSRPRR